MKIKKTPKNNFLNNHLIIDYINHHETFSSDDLINFTMSVDKNFNKRYKNVFIKSLCDNGIIYKFYQKKYKKLSEKKYQPQFDGDLNKLLTSTLGDTDLKVCYIHSSFFNQFSSLQSTKDYTYIFLPRYAIDFFKDKMIKRGKKVIEVNDLSKIRKMMLSDNVEFDYVLKPLSTDAPLFKSKTSRLAFLKLETLLVELISDKVLKEMYASEIDNIYRNALSEYAINFNTLERYALKKGNSKAVNSVLENIGYNVSKGKFAN